MDVSAVSDFDRKLVSHCQGATVWRKIKVGVGEDKGESDGVMNAARCESEYDLIRPVSGCNLANPKRLFVEVDFVDRSPTPLQQLSPAPTPPLTKNRWRLINNLPRSSCALQTDYYCRPQAPRPTPAPLFSWSSFCALHAVAQGPGGQQPILPFSVSTTPRVNAEAPPRCTQLQLL